MPASNTLQLAVELDFESGNRVVNQANASFQTLGLSGEQAGKRAARGLEEMAAASSHAVTGVQATSATLRTLEGSITNNLRAAERFIANTLGLGDILVKAFPVVGAIAFGGVILELGKKIFDFRDKLKELAEQPAKIASESIRMALTMRSSTDEMVVQLDKVNMEIDKLSGRPQNGLQLTLDTAKVSADHLEESLKRDFDALDKLLSDTKTPWWAKPFTAGADDVVANVKKAQEDVYKTQEEGRTALGYAKNNKEVDQIQGAVNTGVVTRYKESIQSLNDQLKQALILQKQNKEAGFLDYMLGPVPDNQNNRVEALKAAIRQQTEASKKVDATYQLDTKTRQEELLRAQVDNGKKLADERKSIQADAARDLTASLEKEYGGYYKIVETYLQKIQAAQEKGALTPKARADYAQAMLNNLNTENRKETAKYVNDEDSNRTAALIKINEGGKAARDYENEVLKAANDATDARYGYEQQKLDESKTLQLAQLDSLNAQTVQQKLFVEQKKLDIEKDFLRQSSELQISKIHADAEVARVTAQGQAEQAILKGGDPNYVNETLRQQRESIGDTEDQQTASVRDKASTQQQQAIDQAAKAQTKVVQDQYKTVYDSILKTSDGFFDALFGKSKSAWQRMGDELKKTFEHALETAISSKVAKYLADLITGSTGTGDPGKRGGNVALGGQGGGGIGGILGSLFGLGAGGAAAGGSTPPFLGSSVPYNGVPGGNNFAGGPGGFSFGGFGGGSFPSTPGFSGAGGDSSSDFSNIGLALPGMASGGFGGGFGGYSGGVPTGDFGSTGAAGGYSGASGGSGGLSGLLGSLFGKGGGNGKAAGGLEVLGGGMALLSSLGQKGWGGAFGSIGGGVSLGKGIATLTNKSGPWGMVGGAGLGLFTNSFSHPGVGGFFEGLGGGTLAGAGFGMMLGGPAGALLGAGIGAAAGLIGGLVNLFRTSPRDRVKKLVQQSYGIKIDDSTADAIVKLAPQYGGDLQLTVSSAQVRNLLSLYSAMHGSYNPNIAPAMQGYTASSQGGTTSIMGGTQFGYSTSSMLGGALPIVSQGGSPAGTAAVGGTTLLRLDNTATTNLLNGLVASGAPQAVSSAYQSSANRSSTAAALLQPGLVTR